MEFIQKSAIEQSIMVKEKYNQQMEALILAKNQDLVHGILGDHQQYQEKLEFIQKTLHGYQLYSVLENFDEDINISTPNIDSSTLFQPIRYIDFLQWGLREKNASNEVQFNNLSPREFIEKNDDFLLIKDNLFGIEEIHYK